MKRRIVKMKSSKKIFRKTAGKHPKNRIHRPIMRGGYRL